VPLVIEAGNLPLHFERCSTVIGSSLGGLRVTGTLGSNFPAMVAECRFEKLWICLRWEKLGSE